MLGTSLLCSATFGWLFSAPITLILAMGVLYGITSLADSPSYSASLMEMVPSHSLGGTFSVQTLFGWAATIVAPVVFGRTLDLIKTAQLGSMIPWGAAFATLAIGPLVGLVALVLVLIEPKNRH
jgi:MFS family permease